MLLDRYGAGSFFTVFALYGYYGCAHLLRCYLTAADGKNRCIRNRPCELLIVCIGGKNISLQSKAFTHINRCGGLADINRGNGLLYRDFTLDGYTSFTLCGDGGSTSALCSDDTL